LVDGIYREQGVPFLCHLIRTASITLSETHSVDVALAAMLHAVYFLHYFEGSSRRGPRAADRVFLRARIGEHAERLVERYAALVWNEPGMIVAYAEQADRHSSETKELLLMKLANELDDHLDAATAYVETSAGERRYDRFGDEYVALAEALGYELLAADLREALDLCRVTEAPNALVRRSSGSWQLRSRLWQANPIERIGSMLRRLRARRGRRRQ
jgi:hypothetical protein